MAGKLALRASAAWPVCAVLLHAWGGVYWRPKSGLLLNRRGIQLTRHSLG